MIDYRERAWAEYLRLYRGPSSPDECFEAAAEIIEQGVRESIRDGVRELDEIAISAWRAREALHLNLAELGRGLDPTTTKNLADLVNDLNEHMPLGEDGHTWRMRPEIRAVLCTHKDEKDRDAG